MKKIGSIFRGDVVLCASFCLALLSCLISPPSGKYFSYIDYHTLILLFCLMVIMEGLREQKVFLVLGHGMLKKVRTQRGVILVLIFLCFVCSMLITNDVALITFVPFGIMILEMADMHGKLCRTVTLMTIAANLGSMFTPIGNPQNLYLYSLSGMSLQEFLRLMLPYTAAAALLLLLAGFFGAGKRSLKIKTDAPELKDKKEIGFYLLLFLCCILSVAGMLPHEILLILVLAGILWKNPGSFRRVDYSLLFTFIFFFIFVGNMKQLEVIHAAMGNLLTGHEKSVSIAVSQVISNVPAAMLLSGYTDQVRELIVGTNLGGLGTLIASMASLISYKQVANNYPGVKKKYFFEFTVWNILFLIVLCLV